MQYKVVYSRRKTVGLTVKDGQLTVRSPYGVKREYLDSLVKEKLPWIEKHIDMQNRRVDRVPELDESQIKELKKLAKVYLTEKTEYYSKLMGLTYTKITITSAKGRFGSCNTKGHICYSYRLMFYPERAREYVVVHELSHLRYMNHSKNFYALVEKYLPDYKEREKLLKN